MKEGHVLSIFHLFFLPWENWMPQKVPVFKAQALLRDMLYKDFSNKSLSF